MELKVVVHPIKIKYLQQYSTYHYYRWSQSHWPGSCSFVRVPCINKFTLRWSILIKNCLLKRSWHHLANAWSMANLPLLYVDMYLYLSFNFQLSKAMSLSSCKSITPCLNLEDPHSLMKCQGKLRVVSIDVEDRASFNLSKACCVLADQWKASFFIKLVRGQSTIE